MNMNCTSGEQQLLKKGYGNVVHLSVVVVAVFVEVMTAVILRT